jgi:hypothetical protein
VAGLGIRVDHVGASLATEIGKVQVGARRRPQVSLTLGIPPERTARDLPLAHVVPDVHSTIELVDPHKIIAPIAIDVGPAVVRTVLFLGELDLVSTVGRPACSATL